jgi:transposase-like protein
MFEERARVVAAVAAGESYRKVARRFDVAPPTVMRWYREARPDDPATVAAALAFLAEGWTPLDVAHAAGVSSETVRRWQREASHA